MRILKLNVFESSQKDYFMFWWFKPIAFHLILYIRRFLVIINRHLYGLRIMVDKFSGWFLAISDRLFQNFLKPCLPVKLDFQWLGYFKQIISIFSPTMLDKFNLRWFRGVSQDTHFKMFTNHGGQFTMIFT